MLKGRLALASAFIAIAALLALLANSDSGHATPNFPTLYGTLLNTTAAGGAGNSTTEFFYGVDHPSSPGVGSVPATATNFSALVGLTPPDVSITPGTQIPVGKIVGQISTSVFLGVLNGDCTNAQAPAFTFRNADTDVRDTISPMPEGSFNGLGNLRLDARGATAGSAPNGVVDYLDAYPAFNNELFDPNDSDVTGATPIYPLRPLARYAGDTNVVGTDVVLQFLVFGPGTLTQFANSGPTNPLQQITDAMGYPSVTVLQNPTASAAPSTVTDFCAPFSSTTALSALTDPEVGVITSQCDDAVNDDGDVSVITAVLNDGCPRIGVAETGAQCAVGETTDGAAGLPEDTPADGAINDGCPAVGGAEDPAQIASQCALAADNDTDDYANDGCPIQGGAPETGAACAAGNVADEDGDFGVNDGCPTQHPGEEGADCANGVDNDGDNAADDGCPTAGSFPESLTAGACRDLIDAADEDPITTGAQADDATINDGCPALAVTTLSTVIEAGTLCLVSINDDSSDDDFVNDGCPAVTAAGGVAEGGVFNSGPCGDTVDSDGDNAVNDGCPVNPVGTAEGAVLNTGPCAGGVDDDGDGIVNDGCPSDGTPETLAQCGDAIDNDDGGAGPINEGCPTALSSVAEAGAACDDATDDEDNYATTAAINRDGAVNDGCPALVLGGAAESGAECRDTIDSADDDSLTNDGCPGLTRQYTRATNPPAGSGLFGTETHLYMSLNIGFRDFDGDGIENPFDTCPFVVNADDPRITAGPDLDMIDSACDSTPGADTNAGDHDLDGFQNAQDNCPQNPNPGQVESESLVILAVSSPDGGSPTDGIGDACDGPEEGAACGNATDDDFDGVVDDGCPGGPATVGSRTVANGHYHATLNVTPVCFAGSADVDFDGWCDATETGVGGDAAFLGSVVGASAAAAETLTECLNRDDDDHDNFINDGCPALTTTGGVAEGGVYGVGVCGDTVDSDGDIAVNDGCPGGGAGPVSETGRECANNTDDEDEIAGGARNFDGVVNDGCPAITTTQAASEPCANAVDDLEDVPADLAVNDGCPTIGAFAESGVGGCADAIDAPDEDPGAPVVNDDTVVNDGCPAVGASESGFGVFACGDRIDGGDPDFLGGPEDGVNADNFVNDGCPSQSTPEHVAVDWSLPISSAGATAIPPATSGVAQTCSDGQDNDGDTLVDGADDGCTAVPADGDADGVCNSGAADPADCVLVAAAVDNCGTVENPTQQNTDADLNASGTTVDPDGVNPAAATTLPSDALGDACDPDDDNDSYTGTAGLFSTTGGATVGVCRSAVSVPTFNDCIENYLGTDPLDNCGENAPDDAWPPDLRRDIAGSMSDVDASDTGRFNIHQSSQDLRSDFNGDLSVNLFDNFLLANTGSASTPPGFFNKDCSPPVQP